VVGEINWILAIAITHMVLVVCIDAVLESHVKILRFGVIGSTFEIFGIITLVAANEIVKICARI